MAGENTPVETPQSSHVDRRLLEVAQRERGAETPVAPEAWTACQAPGRVLVIEPDGSTAACEFTDVSQPSESATAAHAEELQQELRQSILPPHCKGCARWCADDLFSSAPLVRDYAKLHHQLPSSAGTPTPQQDQGRGKYDLVVVRLREDGSNDGGLDNALAAASLAAHLVIEGRDTLASSLANALIQQMPARPDPGKVTLRLTELPASKTSEDTAETPLAQHDTLQSIGRPLTLELLATEATEDNIRALTQASTAVGASTKIRFVATADGWFDFAHVVQLAAKYEASVELRVLDRRGIAPLEDLGASDAAIIRDAAVDHWGELTGEKRPRSLSSGSLDAFCRELRALIGRQLGASEAKRSIELPPLSHSWNQDAQHVERWHNRLFERGDTPLVRAWVSEQATIKSLRDTAWLRALAHRCCYETQSNDLLEKLQQAYGKKIGNNALTEEDADFAKSFDMSRFGGPWSTLIGLAPSKRRGRPFRIGPPSPPTGSDADVTVLIPSYKHARFIEETIRSVLAQRNARFRILIADDCSPDNTADRARSIADDRVDVRVNDNNLGLGNSVLQALDHIETPYIALLNSDDLLHPDHLATCLRALSEDPTASMVCTDIQPVDAKGGRLTPNNVSLVRDGRQVFEWIHWFDRNRAPKEVPRETTFGCLLERNYLVTSSNLFTKTAWLRKQAGSLQSQKYCLDWRLFLQAAAENALLHVRSPLIAYRLHSSNTVWFESERRYTYFLEVNRVAAEALQQYSSTHPDRGAALESVVEAVAHHASHNSETDGYAMFLNAAVNTIALESAASSSQRVKQLLSDLSAEADRRRTGSPLTQQANDFHHQLHLNHLESIHDAERGQRRWLTIHANHLQQTLGEESIKLRNIWNEKLQLEDLRQNLEGEIATGSKQRKDLSRRNERLQRELSATESRREKAQRAKDRLSAESQQANARAKRIEEDLKSSRELLGQLKDNLTKKSAELLETRERATKLRERVESLRSLKLQAAQTAVAKHRESEARIEQLTQRVQRLLTKLEAEKQAVHRAESRIGRQRQSLAERANELSRTLGSREYRIGNFIWNKLYLSSAHRILQKYYRKLRGAWSKQRLARTKPAGRLGRAVVTSTRTWPFHSHTFVYQEVSGMIDAGLDVQFFYWDDEKPLQIHAAFRPLMQRRVRLESVWSTHHKDRDWIDRNFPGKLDGFLERASKELGRSPSELRDDAMILRACTFTRFTAASKARYVHSYFFYDMSFMAMLAAWVLELPRGITCYVDHLLEDSPWKLVRLHIESCSLVVATSNKIKRELSKLSNSEWDDKILVKPNGVDGMRFPAIERPQRKPGTPIELLSISRVEPKKGLIHLVDAVARIIHQFPSLRIHMVGARDPHSAGSIEYADRYRQHIVNRGLQEHFIIHGQMNQEELAPILRQSRAFVAPYVEVESGDKDGIPTAILEAMASSLPILATDSGSITEIITHGKEGLLVPQRDDEALAKAIVRLIESPALEQQMAIAARKRFESTFDTKVTEARLQERIHSILDQGN